MKYLNLDTDTTLGGDNPSDHIISSQRALKTYIDSQPGNTVDQIFDGTSANAQSGIAISGELVNYLTTDTPQDITAVKTFVGQKMIAFKQATSSNKLGFTLYNNNGIEKGYLEFNPTNTIDGAPLMTLGNYATAAAGITHVGFRKYSSVSGASGAYNLLAPLISNARTPFNLTTTYTNFYLPLGFTDGTTMVTTANTGVVDLSSLLPDVSGFATQAWVQNQNYLTSAALADYVTSSSLAITLADYVTNSALATTLSDYALLTDIPSAVTESTVSGWGFTKNTGTVTSVNNTLPDNTGNVNLTIDSSLDSTSTNPVQNKVIAQAIENIALAKNPNLNLIGGNLNIDNGNVSNFSTTDYMQFPFVFNFNGYTWTLEMGFTTGSDVTTQQNILDSYYGIAFAIKEGKFLLAISSNGSSWDIGNTTGTYSVQANTAYSIKIAWNGNSYTLNYALDETNYTIDITISSSTIHHSTQEYVGGEPELFGSGSQHPFIGTINLNNWNLIVNGLEVWLGMDDVGLGSRANIDLSNLTEAGLSRFQEPLVSGTNIKTVNGTSILGSGNIDTSEIFVAEFGTTPYLAVSQAISSNKTVFCKDNNVIYTYFQQLSHAHTFVHCDGKSQLSKITIDSTNTWDIEYSNLANKDLSNLSTTGQAIIDGKVNKAGDTMTGGLSINGNGIVFQAHNTNDTGTCYGGFGSAGAGNLYFFGTLDNNGWSAGMSVNYTNKTISFTSTTGGVYVPNCSANDNTQKTANTAFVKQATDGQWVQVNQTICSDQSLTSSSDTNLLKTVTLPNDGHNYEVALRAQCTTGTTSGNYLQVYVSGNVIGGANYFICSARTRTNSSNTTCGTVILPMKYGSNNLTILRRSSYTGTCDITAIAYRRTGTNT